MLNLIIGLILLVIPFLFIEFFNDKKRGFIYVFFFSVIFHTTLAFLTQASGIFYYKVILIVNLLTNIILLAVYFKISKKYPFKIPKIDWVLLIVMAIAFLTLYQVHYNYTGKINLATDKVVSYHEVKNMKYVYPYFSDEWYSVSLIKYSINSHSLPLKNVFNNSFFLNLEMFFHSLTAEIILLLDLNPLTQYALISIFINVSIIILAYIFLRLNNASKLVAAISSLSILYITCGANLPGIWHLIPVNLGIVFFLIGFCFMSVNKLRMAFLSFLFVLLFYPPLFIFYGLGMLVFLFHKFPKTREKTLKIIGYSGIVLFLIIPTFYIILIISPFESLAKYIFSKIFYISLSGSYIPQYDFYNIISLPIILLAILGSIFIYKNKKWLLTPLFLSILFWFTYALTTYRVMIDFERVVFFTAIIISLVSGFGLEGALRYVDTKVKKTKYPISKYIEVGALLLFLLLIPFYTQRENWLKLILIDPINGAKVFPKAPANNYLTEDDIRIFKDIKDKRFLSIPWKGTVIGVATDNYPIATKEGTISVGSEKTADIFLNSDCVGKKRIIKENKVDYVYTPEFNCPSFEKIDKSQEEFVLYKVKNGS